ncbi:hypothetical protein K6119_07985 [Paracrocinitomix mangrovi]|uniref:hypothetical protein n=1 Tax=Paracrocinitomix mangrovi TaxID=2862509 RepID=UPI001EDC7F2C|nr:hypothetical protein [Paracrocinitomix mangrovi]UKN03451.1 hypothetical protein K6119_07985 [Paracrocinitomix mangrovi]
MKVSDNQIRFVLIDSVNDDIMQLWEINSDLQREFGSEPNLIERTVKLILEYLETGLICAGKLDWKNSSPEFNRISLSEAQAVIRDHENWKNFDSNSGKEWSYALSSTNLENSIAEENRLATIVKNGAQHNS